MNTQCVIYLTSRINYNTLTDLKTYNVRIMIINTGPHEIQCISVYLHVHMVHPVGHCIYTYTVCVLCALCDIYKGLLRYTDRVSLHETLVVLTDGHQEHHTSHMIKTVDPLSSL